MARLNTLLALVLLAVTLPGGLRAEPARQKTAALPNILILYADDLGYGDLGCYNADSKIPTPHLDQLAAAGIRFTDGHSSSGICTPSRYALLTGRHHWRDFHGIVNALGPSVFKPERLTLPELLQEKGYHTAYIGKWHLGWDWSSIRKPGAKPRKDKKGAWSHESFHWDRPIADGPLAHGFHHYFGDNVINFPPYCWIEDDRVTRHPDTTFTPGQHKSTTKEGNWEARPGPALADWDFYRVLPTLADKGVAHVKARAGEPARPWFLYFSFPSPHAPIIPNDEFDGKSKAGAYGDFVYQTDHICGQILQALKETGQWDNTLVLFTADNGPERYAYPRDEKHQHWSSHPLRGLKRDIYEGGHRVPFLLKPHRALRGKLDQSLAAAPGEPPLVQKSGPGLVCHALVSQIDVMATIASLVDHKLPAKNAAEDSHDLLPLLSGTSRRPPRTTHIHNTNRGSYAIRHGDYVLIAHTNGYISRGYGAWEKKRGYPADDDGPVELYNLRSDLAQKQNLAQDHPEKVAELQALLKKIREQGHSAPRLQAPASNPR